MAAPVVLDVVGPGDDALAILWRQAQGALPPAPSTPCWWLYADQTTSLAPESVRAAEAALVEAGGPCGHAAAAQAPGGPGEGEQAADVGLWVGQLHFRPQDKRSLLHAYLCRRRARRWRGWGAVHGADVPADWVPGTGVIVGRAALRAAPAPDPALSIAAQWANLARFAYAAGLRLAYCPALRAEVEVGGSWAQATRAWTQAGTDWAHVAVHHGDPHLGLRLRQRLGPYQALLGQVDALAGQLAQLDDQLARTGGVGAQHLQRLGPSVDQLYAACALRGVLAHARGRALLAEPHPKVKPHARFDGSV